MNILTRYLYSAMWKVFEIHDHKTGVRLAESETSLRRLFRAGAGQPSTTTYHGPELWLSMPAGTQSNLYAAKSRRLSAWHCTLQSLISDRTALKRLGCLQVNPSEAPKYRNDIGIHIDRNSKYVLK